LSTKSLLLQTTAFYALLGGSLAFAADDEPEAGAEKAEVKEGGKFSLIGRECKAEPDEGIEATPGSPPLDVDDPGTPGCNGWEINIVTSGELGTGMTGETPLFDINYGIGDNIQLKGEVPYELSRADGATTSGLGRAEFGIKYRFYEDESRALSMAIYPQLEFAVPGTAADEGDEGVGTITKLPVLFSTKVGETAKGDIMITANLGYNISTVPSTADYISASFGVGFPLTSGLAVMAEASTEQALTRNMDNVRDSVVKANVGLFGRVNDHLLLLGALGESYSASNANDSMHTCVILGVRILAGGP
jgi:hypothetical protein